MLYGVGLRVRYRMRILARTLSLAQATPYCTATAQAMAATGVLSVWCCFLRGAEHPGEHANQNHTERRHACADDTDVDFDVGPVDDVGLIPRWVFGRSEVYER